MGLEELQRNPLVKVGLNLLGNLLLDAYQAQPEPEREPEPPELAEIPDIQKIVRKPGGVILILGARDTGKTVLSLRLAEIINKPIYCIWPEQNPPKGVISITTSEIDSLPPNGSTLLLDDIPVTMSSRDYHRRFSQTVERLIPVVRHKRQMHLIFSSQASSMADRYVLDADLVFLKRANKLLGSLERPAVIKLYRQVSPLFDQMSERQQQRHVFIYSQNFTGIARVGWPSLLEKKQTTARTTT